MLRGIVFLLVLLLLVNAGPVFQLHTFKRPDLQVFPNLRPDRYQGNTVPRGPAPLVSPLGVGPTDLAGFGSQGLEMPNAYRPLPPPTPEAMDLSMKRGRQEDSYTFYDRTGNFIYVEWKNSALFLTWGATSRLAPHPLVVLKAFQMFLKFMIGDASGERDSLNQVGRFEERLLGKKVHAKKITRNILPQYFSGLAPADYGVFGDSMDYTRALKSYAETGVADSRL